MNYQKHYDLLIERARNRVPEGYVERHHIKPVCMGGSNDNDNLVALYPEEHFVAHVLLVKMFPEHPGLIVAVQMMTQGHAGRRVRRKLYGWLKREFSEYMKSYSGEKNSQFGSKWVNDGLQNKKLKRGEPIPEGFLPGKVRCQKPKSEDKRKLRTESREARALLALQTSESISKAISSLGLQERGANYAYFKQVAQKYGLAEKFNHKLIKWDVGRTAMHQTLNL